jgi:hypothetical protein
MIWLLWFRFVILGLLLVLSATLAWAAATGRE